MSRAKKICCPGRTTAKFWNAPRPSPLETLFGEGEAIRLDHRLCPLAVIDLSGCGPRTEAETHYTFVFCALNPVAKMRSCARAPGISIGSGEVANMSTSTMLSVEPALSMTEVPFRQRVGQQLRRICQHDTGDGISRIVAAYPDQMVLACHYRPANAAPRDGAAAAAKPGWCRTAFDRGA